MFFMTSISVLNITDGTLISPLFSRDGYIHDFWWCECWQLWFLLPTALMLMFLAWICPFNIKKALKMLPSCSMFMFLALISAFVLYLLRASFSSMSIASISSLNTIYVESVHKVRMVLPALSSLKATLTSNRFHRSYFDEISCRWFFPPFIHQQAGQKQDSLVDHLSELGYDSAFVSVDML